MPVIDDSEFGAITIRRSSVARSMRASVAPNGSLRISVPSYAPLFMVKRMIASMRPQLRKLLSAQPIVILTDGMPVGKSHSLLVRTATDFSIRRSAQQLIASLPDTSRLNDPDVVREVRAHMRAILRKEAKHYLPRRLRFLADQHGFDYTSIRFTHASSRWGSCNHKKAISLNIALMNLPFELIDYVLIHELAHTVELNHSTNYWREVERAEPNYKRHRSALKSYNPAI